MAMIPSFGDFGFGFPSRNPNSIFDPFGGDEFFFPFNPFGSGAVSFPRANDVAAFAGARMDWKETGEAHVIKADLPGVRKEEVKVEVEDGKVLKISAERRREEEEKTDTWHRVERSSGSFMRKFRLPEDAKVDQVKAAMEGGVLTVTVPKVGGKKAADVKSIPISG